MYEDQRLVCTVVQRSLYTQQDLLPISFQTRLQKIPSDLTLRPSSTASSTLITIATKKLTQLHHARRCLQTHHLFTVHLSSSYLRRVHHAQRLPLNDPQKPDNNNTKLERSTLPNVLHPRQPRHDILLPHLPLLPLLETQQSQLLNHLLHHRNLPGRLLPPFSYHQPQQGSQTPPNPRLLAPPRNPPPS